MQDDECHPLVSMFTKLDKPNRGSKSLLKTILNQKNQKNSSFHMPGHKSVFSLPVLSAQKAIDVFDIDTTELSGLDDLTYPISTIDQIEKKLAKVYGTKASLISLGGSSHGLIAAMISCHKKDNFVLVPRNAHRSIINGLVLSGSNLVWYEPEWQEEWQLWGTVRKSDLLSQIGNLDMTKCSAVVVVSPTFAGAVSDIAALKDVCQKSDVPLIVDEAHGAHLLPGCDLPNSAIAYGADLVVHSLHKTLPGLTQTGVVHITENSRIERDNVKSALRLVTSSSPSYPLMVSIESVADLISSNEFCGYLNQLGTRCRGLSQKLAEIDEISVYFQAGFAVDPFHILIKCANKTGAELVAGFEKEGVFVESELGNGCLLLAGAGTTESDLELVLKVSAKLASESRHRSSSSECLGPVRLQQAINPRKAYFSETEALSLEEAGGRVAAECVSPCPPGVPVISPGALVPKNVNMSKSVVGSVKVVK